MRIAIVDDLETERAQLKTRLARQLRLCGAEAQLLEFESGESFQMCIRDRFGMAPTCSVCGSS